MHTQGDRQLKDEKTARALNMRKTFILCPLLFGFQIAPRALNSTNNCKCNKKEIQERVCVLVFFSVWNLPF